MKKITALIALATTPIALLIATTGGAQTTGGRTITVFEDATHESSTFIDNQPRSPTPNPGSRRFRLSTGDELVARVPVLDGPGGKRIGTAYAHGSIAKGTRFENATLQAQATMVLRNGAIIMAGLAGAGGRKFAVIGGTGAYQGAHGTTTERETQGGSQIAIHLLP